MDKEPIRIALVGYGFNQLVERAALNANEVAGRTRFVIDAIIRSKDSVTNIPPSTLVVVDSASDTGTMERIKYYSERAMIVIVATTGKWKTEENMARIREWYQHSPGAILISPILSKEVFTLYARTMQLTEELLGCDPLRCEIEIFDHCPHWKKDKPSGTALLLAEGIRKICPDATITFTSVRQGDRRYDHKVTFRILNKSGDCIGEKEATHHAKTRRHIAEGIVQILEAMVQEEAQGTYEIESIPHFLGK